MTIHGMDIATSTDSYKIKNPHLSPDENDPNFYCRACEKTWTCKINYRIHLTLVHGMKLERKHHPVVIKHHDIQPGVYDPNNYCCACGHTFAKRETYRYHLKSIHEIYHFSDDKSHPMIIHPHLSPDKNDPDFYCRACERYYSNRKRFRRHLSTIHKMSKNDLDSSDEEEEETMESILSSYAIPDKNDSNFHCDACGNTFSTKQVYHQHLQCVHKLVVNLPFQTSY